MAAVRGRVPAEQPVEEHAGRRRSRATPESGRLGDPRGRHRVQDEDRRLDARRRAAAGPRRSVATHRPSTPATASARATGDGAVPVGVRLDDRPDADCRAGGRARIARGWRASAVEVDLQPRRPRQRRQAGRRQAVLDGRPHAVASFTPGRAPATRRRWRRLRRPRAEPEPARGIAAPLGRRGQSLARERDPVGQVGGQQAGIAEPLADAVAGEAVQVDPEACRGERVEPLRQQRRRSSRPARRRSRRVASAGFSNGATATRPSGAAMTVRRPSARRPGPSGRRHRGPRPTRAASSSPRSPSSAGSRPLPPRSRANSPACGVSTAGRRPPPTRRPSRRASGAPRRRARRAPVRASSTSSSSRTSSAVASPGRSPGPTTSASCSWSRIRASAASGSTSSTSSSGSAHRGRLDHLRGEQRLERLGHGEGHEPGPGRGRRRGRPAAPPPRSRASRR